MATIPPVPGWGSFGDQSEKLPGTRVQSDGGVWSDGVQSDGGARSDGVWSDGGAQSDGRVQRSCSQAPGSPLPPICLPDASPPLPGLVLALGSSCLGRVKREMVMTIRGWRRAVACLLPLDSGLSEVRAHAHCLACSRC